MQETRRVERTTGAVRARYVGRAMYPGYGAEGWLEWIDDEPGAVAFWPDVDPDPDAPAGSGYYGEPCEYEPTMGGAA